MPVYIGGSSSVSATVSLATLVGRMRNKFLVDEAWEDTLSGAQTSGATTISLTNITKWTPNDLIELPDGEVERFIPSASALSNPATVKRAHNGTTAAAHSSGDVALKNPRFPFQIVSDHISQVATNLTWPWMWVVSSMSITPSPSTANVYAITDTAYQNPIIATQQQTSTVTDVAVYPWIEIIDVPVAVSATGKAVRLTSFDNLTNAVTFYYQAKITSATIPEGDISEAILLKSAANILRYKQIQVRNQDSGTYGQDHSSRSGAEAALQSQIRDYDNQWRMEKYRIRADLKSQFMPQERWTSFAGVLPISGSRDGWWVQ